MDNKTENKGFLHSASNTIKKFGPAEKLIFYIFSFLLCVGAFGTLLSVNSRFLIEVPAKGGLLREGFIGSPRFINPILAISETDKALSSLVFSGLLKADKDGGYVTDLAEYYSVSDDGLSYYFKIKENAVFQNKSKVTVDDIIYTIDKVLDPAVRSPKRSNWEGVKVEKVNDSEVIFTLSKPYSPFLESLTLGILPISVWQDVGPEELAFGKWNIEAVGSGPYKINSVERDSDGIPTKINLESFNKYTLEEAKISNIEASFFKDQPSVEKAFAEDTVDSFVKIEDQEVIENSRQVDALYATMPRIFGLFFNQNHSAVLANKEVREALDQSLDKQGIVDVILKKYGTVIDGPTPADSSDVKLPSIPEEERINKAKEILRSAGWKENAEGVMEKKGKSSTQILSFSISTSDVLDLKETANLLAETWAKIGARVEVKVFEASDLNTSVIRRRNYDALLFGIIVGRDLDLYPFWHSSERNDPGLNISLYANITADKLLEASRASETEEDKLADLEKVKAEIKKDIPAIFLYAPKYAYNISTSVKNVSIAPFGNQSDRFLNIKDWYIKTNKIWRIFQTQ